MTVLPPDGSAIVARFTDTAAADAAAREYAAQAFGLWPPVDANGLRTVTRPAGDYAALVVAGRTVVVVSGADQRALPKRLLSLGAIAPGRAQSDPGSEHYWLYRRGVLPLLIVLLGAAYVFAFFKGATWAGASPPVPGSTPTSESELRRRLLAVDGAGAPFTIAPEPGGPRLVATWRYADARWLDFARARRMQRVQRLVLELDPGARVVRVTEQASQLDADLGRGGASLEWRTTRGFTFFEVQRGRVFGLRFDADGRPLPQLDYEWRYDSREMKGPLSDAVTRAGWEWRPTPWLGPTWLRWLTG